jgi:hypothetical protein
MTLFLMSMCSLSLTFIQMPVLAFELNYPSFLIPYTIPMLGLGTQLA